MKRSVRIVAMALALLAATPAMAGGPIRPITPGSPIWLDEDGDQWWCPNFSPVNCIPLGDSEPPIEP